PPPTPNTSPLSLHDALPIFSMTTLIFRPHLTQRPRLSHSRRIFFIAICSTIIVITTVVYLVFAKRMYNGFGQRLVLFRQLLTNLDRKSTRLNSSHVNISYAV